MERIAAILQQLQEAVNAGSNPAQLLVLSRMLQAEIEKLQPEQEKIIGTPRVAVVLPAAHTTAGPVAPSAHAVRPTENATAATNPDSIPEEEKVFEILRVDEAELEAELAEIKEKAEFVNKAMAQQRLMPGRLFEADTEIPTLVHQPHYKKTRETEAYRKEINETVGAKQISLNDQLATSKPELAEQLSAQPIKDLRKAIGVNDRYVFINELFRGDEIMYERSIKTINNFSILAEAEYWIQRELKIKLGWDDAMPAVAQFYALVKRRFS